MRTILDLASPVRCLACGIEADAELCERCAHGVAIIGGPACERCGTPGAGRCSACRDLRGFDRARSLVVFAEPARSLTLALKRRGRRGLARDIGSLVAGLVRRERLQADVITFVPAGRRADRRGFDPAKLLARAVGRELGLSVQTLLVRANDGPRQADVPLRRRRSNVAGRFVARPCTGRVLLVDDVFTTGATAEACAVALKRAGAGRVDVVTWARTLRYLRRQV